MKKKSLTSLFLFFFFWNNNLPLSTFKNKKASFKIDLYCHLPFTKFGRKKKWKKGALPLWEHWPFVCVTLNEWSYHIFMKNLLSYYCFPFGSTWICNLHTKSDAEAQRWAPFDFENKRKQRAIFLHAWACRLLPPTTISCTQ